MTVLSTESLAEAETNSGVVIGIAVQVLALGEYYRRGLRSSTTRPEYIELVKTSL